MTSEDPMDPDVVRFVPGLMTTVPRFDSMAAVCFGLICAMLVTAIAWFVFGSELRGDSMRPCQRGFASLEVKDA